MGWARQHWAAVLHAGNKRHVPTYKGGRRGMGENRRTFATLNARLPRAETVGIPRALRPTAGADAAGLDNEDGEGADHEEEWEDIVNESEDDEGEISD